MNLTELCKLHNIKWAKIKADVYTLNKGGKVIDVFVKTKKCYSYVSQEYGTFKDFESLLKKEYGI